MYTQKADSHLDPPSLDLDESVRVHTPTCEPFQPETPYQLADTGETSWMSVKRQET